jgi:Cu(I)/Ag(I) efflux system periplasmic protein CusF
MKRRNLHQSQRRRSIVVACFRQRFETLMKFNRVLVASVIAIVGASGVHAQSADAADHAARHAQPVASAAGQDLLSDGEVRRINREAGKVTLRHGPLTNLDMPAMTMVFTAADPALLDGLKEGDKVRFTADRKDGSFVVTAIRVVQ